MSGTPLRFLSHARARGIQVVAAALGALWITSVILSADGFLSELWALIRQPINAHFLAAGVAVGIYIVALVWLVRTSAGRDRRGLWTLGGIVLLVGFLVRLIWVIVFDSYQISDYGSYLTCGQEIANGQVENCMSTVHWSRGLFIAAPVIALFGLDLGAVEGANLVVYLLTGGLFLMVADRLVGLRRAVVGSAFLVVAPELFYAVTLASHDLHGVFWLLVFLLLAFHLERSLRPGAWSPSRFAAVAGLSLSLGMVLTALTFSRTYGMFAAAALVVWTLWVVIEPTPGQPRTIWNRIVVFVFLLLVPVVVDHALQGDLAQRFQRPDPSSDYHRVGGLTATNILTANTYPDQRLWKRLEFPLLYEQGRTDFAWAKWGHEWSFDLGVSLQHLFRKNRLLSMSGGNRDGASAVRTAPDGRDPAFHQVGRVNFRGWQVQDRWIRMLNLLFIGLFLARLLLVRRIPFRREEVPILAFSSFTYYAFIFIGETQPRYDVFLLIPGSYMAAQVLIWALEGRPERAPASASSVRVPLLGGLAMLVGFGILAVVGLKQLPRLGYALDDLSVTRLLTEEEVAELVPGGVPADGRIDAAFNQAAIGFPDSDEGIEGGSAVGARVSLPPKAGGRGVLEGFLLLAPEAIDDEGPLGGTGMEAFILADRDTVWSGALGGFEARFLEVPVEDRDGDGLIDVDMVVRASRDVPATQVPDFPALRLEHARVR